MIITKNSILTGVLFTRLATAGSDYHIRQTWFAHEDLPLIVLLKMASIATGFSLSVPVRIGFLKKLSFNSSSHSYGMYVMHFLCAFPHRKCVWGLSVKILSTMSSPGLALINVRYKIFRHSFVKHTTFPYFFWQSIQNLYASINQVEKVSYEIWWGYVVLIEI